jgi:hypothetical protein
VLGYLWTSGGGPVLFSLSQRLGAGSEGQNPTSQRGHRDQGRYRTRCLHAARRLLEEGQRQGRNPQTGEPITITERRVLNFKASQLLKQALNGAEEGADAAPAKDA